MGAPFKFLPKKYELLFLDTSVFNLTPKEQNFFGGTKSRMINPEYFDESRIRLKFLNKYLEKMDNWLTVDEVIEEHKIGINKLKSFVYTVRDRNLTISLEKFLDEDAKTTNMLEMEERSVTKSNTEKFNKLIYGPNLRWIQRKFDNINGKTGETNADCVLASAAIIFAIDNPVYLFSDDKDLRYTFASRAVSFIPKLKRTYVIQEEEERAVSTEEYMNVAK